MYNSCMELAHTSHADQTQAVQDSILTAFIEPGALPDIAKRVNMSLASLATWASKHAELLDNVHKLLVTRCKLIAAHLELSALSALAAVSGAATPTDDAKLRERSLERQRKAASAILRHKNKIERNPRASSTNPERELGVPCAFGRPSDPHAPTAVSFRAASSTNPERELGAPCVPVLASDSHTLTPVTSRAAASPSHVASLPKPSLEQRLAAKRLAALTAR